MKISRGGRTGGLLSYLVGPGRANESAWAALEPAEFEGHRQALREGIKARFGVDMNETSTGAGKELADRSTSNAAAQKTTPVVEADEVGAAVVAAGAGADMDADADAHADAHEKQDASAAAAAPTSGSGTTVGYDSDQRRAELFDRATQAGVDQDTAAGRVRASEAFAEPSAQAWHP